MTTVDELINYAVITTVIIEKNIKIEEVL